MNGRPDARAIDLSDPAPLETLVSLARGKAIVALTGAGLSTESGIPDYRSPEALAKPRRPIQGPDFVRSEAVRRRYWARATRGWEMIRSAQPNAGHFALAALERESLVTHVITQNVDRLHRKAGSQRVTELHGALAEVACLACGRLEDRDAFQVRLVALNPDIPREIVSFAPDGDADLPPSQVESFRIPACLHCDGVLKPRVVFFGDNVPRPLVDEAFEATDGAGLLLVVGSSLAVFSGYRFLRRAVERKTPIAIVNRGPVRGEEHAALKIDAGTGATLVSLAQALGARA
jgi:NAD-dependent deacetylase sirtuin 4